MVEENKIIDFEERRQQKMFEETPPRVGGSSVVVPNDGDPIKWAADSYRASRPTATGPAQVTPLRPKQQ